jgi:hypothetical protein
MNLIGYGASTTDRADILLLNTAHELPSIQKREKRQKFLMKKCTNGVLIKLKTLTETYSARVDVSLQGFKPRLF